MKSTATRKIEKHEPSPEGAHAVVTYYSLLEILVLAALCVLAVVWQVDSA